jgi:hypothetical protein
MENRQTGWYGDWLSLRRDYLEGYGRVYSTKYKGKPVFEYTICLYTSYPSKSIYLEERENPEPILFATGFSLSLEEAKKEVEDFFNGE